ncbi:hypothetical protein [Bosea sp. (in: a-proteobacteria)]|uniref:hypothetical protein n=1 Tax=Bosea sp. (in: a-proteobacteria) TaxID=1871050 RepID=UPI001ACE9D68|nr:hypothetical protein [Bosea sp. (in: a-proteobacteria)]MBN9440766.1 hypothetical protein [Bosea sp. (in: a-proteobacteria)]
MPRLDVEPELFADQLEQPGGERRDKDAGDPTAVKGFGSLVEAADRVRVSPRRLVATA